MGFLRDKPPLDELWQEVSPLLCMLIGELGLIQFHLRAPQLVWQGLFLQVVQVELGHLDLSVKARDFGSELLSLCL